MTNLTEYQIPIKTLFELTNSLEILVEQPNDIKRYNIEIKTPNGWQSINSVVRKVTDAARYMFDNGFELICATKHLVFEHGNCKPINLCNYIDTISKTISIVGSEFLGKMELFDVAIDYPHQYITTNGIIHHNTTLARCLLNELGVESSDIKYVNASHHTGVDYLRNLNNFIETMPSGEFRYVLLDEADFLSPNSQALLRSMIEEYSSVCRWILTCNYPNKVIPALHSRTQGFHIEKLDREQFASRAASILITEGIDLDEDGLDILDEYITATYPDLRKCINMLQQNSSSGKLTRPSRSNSSGAGDWLVQAIALFKTGRITEARKTICGHAQAEDYEDIYKMLYQNLNWWGESESAQNKAIVIIANRLRDHAICADSEMNLAACLVELSLISN